MAVWRAVPLQGALGARMRSLFREHAERAARA